MIRITRKGFKGKGIYIGRPSVFGNPFPVKKSKFSKKTYSIRESLKLYIEYFERNILPRKYFSELLDTYRREKYLELDCFCIDKTIKSISDINIEQCKCHGEIIAYFILKFYDENKSIK